ncbi:MAG TPA: aminoglycoside phosphotransferase family protein [Kribbellaceae bacterium]|nr:aminoglycoside phosphotransferase family protein [Kribbellaceae bacterium]
MPVVVPERFRGFADRGEEWARWLDRLPRLVGDLLGEWDLTADGAAVHGECALVVPVRTADGVPAVLKVSWPHWEAEYEHLALRDWDGAGSVRLLRADPHRFALLLERVHPRDLTTVEEIEATELVAATYRRLHVPAGPQYRRLSVEVTRWADGLAALPSGAPVPRRYVEQAVSLARDLAADPDCDGRLIHTDLHYFNVLAADREPWLVIDPKPLSGDPHYEVAPLLWNRWDAITATGDVRAAVRRRFHAAVDAAGLDEDRARDWVVVRELCNIGWAIEDLGGRLVDPETQDWITTALAIAKAVQD